MTPADDARWLKYLQSVGDDAAPRETLLQALSVWQARADDKAAPGRAPGKAIDLGAGQGRDTFHLLQSGWTVIAVDRTTAALKRMEQTCPTAWRSRLTLINVSFEVMEMPKDVDLVNASYSLPFCRPDRFEAVWAGIEHALGPGGLFCGHLLGPKDDWAGPDVVSETPEAVKARFASWTDVRIEETDGPAPTAKGRTKHWHLFKIVAVR